jgi:serine/threonine-protein kinase
MINHPKQLGPYQIIRPLGRGGMGAVYEGLHIETGEPAAVKVLLESIDDDPDVRNRFEAEIDALKMLRHPHIVRLNGFGEENGRLYYVMELINGQSLYQELKRKRSFTWQDVAKIGYEMCLALKHGHDRGIIHRDIKPANIMLDNSGSLKLSDYGIAHFFGSDRLTNSNSVIGTIEFMSPEQATAAPVTPKSDLYSLGAVLYTLLCRRPPLLAKTLAEIIKKHRNEQPEGVMRLRHDVPNVLINIVHDLLEIKPENRPANAYLVARQIETLLVNEFGSIDAVIVLPSNEEIQDIPPSDDRDTKTLLQEQMFSGEEGKSADNTDDSAFLLLIEDRLDPTKIMTEEISAGKVPDDFSAVNQNHSEEMPSARLAAESGEAEMELATHAKERNISTSPDSINQTVREGYSGSSRFVRIKEEDLGQYSKIASNPNPLISVQVGVLSVCLVVLGLWAWYMLQPKSAESLYKSIKSNVPANVQNVTPSMLFSIENDVNKFLQLYPKDVNNEEIRGYSNEIKLAQQERRLERRQNTFNSDQELLPVERVFLEAITLSNTSPQAAAEKFEAIIDLYGNVSEEIDWSNPNSVCVELAKRRLNRLRKQLDIISERDQGQLTMLMDKADEMEKTDPGRANRMRRGLIHLYRGKPWAEDLLKKAEEKLQSL